MGTWSVVHLHEDWGRQNCWSNTSVGLGSEEFHNWCHTVKLFLKCSWNNSWVTLKSFLCQTLDMSFSVWVDYMIAMFNIVIIVRECLLWTKRQVDDFIPYMCWDGVYTHLCIFKNIFIKVYLELAMQNLISIFPIWRFKIKKGKINQLLKIEKKMDIYKIFKTWNENYIY